MYTLGIIMEVKTFSIVYDKICVFTVVDGTRWLKTVCTTSTSIGSLYEPIKCGKNILEAQNINLRIDMQEMLKKAPVTAILKRNPILQHLPFTCFGFGFSNQQNQSDGLKIVKTIPYYYNGIFIII